jgi:hypothetical protein
MTKSWQWLHTHLNYDPATGVFTWKTARRGRPYGHIPAGTRAGSVWDDGYRRICIEGRSYRASRLAVLFMTGEWPPYQVDHKNRERSDDRWSNLRLAMPFQNQGNRPVNPNNSLGIKGVCYEPGRKKYKAYIQVAGRTVNLGRFDTAEEAKAAYDAAAKKYFGEFARE